MLTTEELGRELAKLQKQLSLMRLQALVRTKDNSVAYGIGEVARNINSPIYNHHATSEKLDELEAIVARNKGNP